MLVQSSPSFLIKASDISEVECKFRSAATAIPLLTTLKSVSPY